MKTETKLKKQFKKLEFDLRDQIWLALNPPKFKEGDKVWWYENPCYTSAPEDAPKPIRITIEFERPDLVICSRKKLQDEYYSPCRAYWAKSKNKGPVISVFEGCCTKTK